MLKPLSSFFWLLVFIFFPHPQAIWYIMFSKNWKYFILYIARFFYHHQGLHAIQALFMFIGFLIVSHGEQHFIYCHIIHSRNKTAFWNRICQLSLDGTTSFLQLVLFSYLNTQNSPDLMIRKNTKWSIICFPICQIACLFSCRNLHRTYF